MNNTSIVFVAQSLYDDRYKHYDVSFNSDRIYTMVTSDPNIVTMWIIEAQSDYNFRNVVGLDIKCSHRQNRVATLQLCIGSACLIFQLLHSRSIPQSLITFLQTYHFVGVGIEADVEMLERDHGIRVRHSVDLRELAATAYTDQTISNDAGLKELCSVVLGKELVQPRHVTTSRWDDQCLNEEQVQYACLDAFVSLEIEKRLNASGYGVNRL